MILLSLGILCFAFGMVLIFLGIYAFLKRWNQISQSSSTVGVVTHHKKKRDSEGEYYYPWVKFQIPSGHDFIFESEVGADPPIHRVGQKVVVLYNPNDPQQAVIKNFSTLWTATMILTFGGLICIFVGFGLFLRGVAELII